jgi:uncharacterized protein
MSLKIPIQKLDSHRKGKVLYPLSAENSPQTPAGTSEDPSQLAFLADTPALRNWLSQNRLSPERFGPLPLSWEPMDTGFRFHLSGKVTPRFTCDLCLEDFDLESSLNQTAYFVSDGISDESLQHELPEEISWQYSLSSKEPLNLEPFILDALEEITPLVCKCKEDCAGLCTQCGQNLNRSEVCTCVALN